MGIKRFCLGFLVIIGLVGCASKILKYDKAAELKKNSEFDQAVKIEIAEPPPTDIMRPAPNATPQPTVVSTSTTVPPKSKGKKDPEPKQKKDKKKIKTEAQVPTRRQPDLEEDSNFTGRRPNLDPYRVGEKVIHDITYAGLTAGQIVFEVRPWAQVNGKKSYHFATSIKSTSIFSKFYAVDDIATTLLDFESLIPSVYTLTVKESAQLREAQMLFDWNESRAKFWEKKVTEKSGMEEKKQNWEIPNFSQNVFSIIYYLRVFTWDVGKTHSFRVAHDNENLVFKATAVRREKIKTDVGEFTALVIRPEIELKGMFKSIGDNFIWISDDDRKLVLRIESKIKIGSLVSEVVDIKSGI